MREWREEGKDYVGRDERSVRERWREKVGRVESIDVTVCDVIESK